MLQKLFGMSGYSVATLAIPIEHTTNEKSHGYKRPVLRFKALQQRDQRDETCNSLKDAGMYEGKSVQSIVCGADVSSMILFNRFKAAYS